MERFEGTDNLTKVTAPSDLLLYESEENRVMIFPLCNAGWNPSGDASCARITTSYTLLLINRSVVSTEKGGRPSFTSSQICGSPQRDQYDYFSHLRLSLDNGLVS
ncbi:MAG: hypothetical protein EZS28_029005 [Streblomastix strix]|uniref:Uncharacterized protein n=1 Tax=Streblomastix strix TaxID=222440 RepID=A0A5J4UYG2_9EUKA|nr:MAG: hypothetical protein EZS28_029005 [Streblomastix strix]